ncbi:MAG: hypothetical protein ABWK05_05515 [Pyrobaculum sp.]
MRGATVGLALALALAAYTLAQPPQMFCATAGELGLAGEPPDLAFSVFERGSWRPALAYVEPENVTFLLVPALVGNKTDLEKIKRGVLPGQLPPPVLKNSTKICFEAGRGVPQAKPPAHGRLVVVEKKGAKYHVFVTRVVNATPANFSIPVGARADGEKPDSIEARGELPRGQKAPREGQATIQQTVVQSYWASFKLYKAYNKDVAPGGCVYFNFDTPAETSNTAVVLLGGTTPGTYSYYVEKRQGSQTQRFSGNVVVYSGLPQTIVVWMGGGRATYLGRICNQNSNTAKIYTAALLQVSNQLQYLRVDTVKMRETPIILDWQGYEPVYYNNHLLQNSYIAIPGFYADAASTIIVDVYLRVPKDRASTTLYVYWGALYLGSITGAADPSDSRYLVFNTRLSVPSNLFMALLPTNGLGGVISIGPVDARFPGFRANVRVQAYVQRPTELAPAGDGSYFTNLTKRLKETIIHFEECPFSVRAYMNNLEFLTHVRDLHLVVNINPFNFGTWNGKSSYATIRYYLKAYDSGLRELSIQQQGGTGEVYTKGSAWWLEWLKAISVVVSMGDLVKSTIDALKGATAGFPIIGYVTLALDSYVSNAQASLKFWVEGNSLVVEFYTGFYDDPLVGSLSIRLPSEAAYLAVTKAEVMSCIITYYYTLYQVNGPVWPTTTIGYASVPASLASQFPFRTLTCGAQEMSSSPNTCVNENYR